MNKGRLWETRKQTFLTILNAVIIPLGVTIVSSTPPGGRSVVGGVLTIIR
jgi:hypothetical protein